jgi:hypothetical protein
LFFILLGSALTILALWIGGCKQPTTEQEAPGWFMTIKNESSYDLAGVTWSGLNFALPNQTDLLKGTASKMETTEDASGYIYFTRKDMGINLRTHSVWTTGDSPVTIRDNAVVIEVANENNMGTLSAISLVAEIGVEYGGRSVARNDTINTGETVINSARQIQITLKSAGSGGLTLTGVEPVQLDGLDNSFSVTQPARSEITASTPVNAMITFTPASPGPHTTTVTIKSNAPSGDFTFTISGTGIPAKPIIAVYSGTAEIPQNGTVDMGAVALTLPGTVTVTLKNTGTEALTITPEGITVDGSDAGTFSFDSLPAGTISANSSSTFVIRCTPTEVREYSAAVSIPNNDTSRNPAVFLAKVTGFIPPPNTPDGLNASALSSSSIQITWNAAAGASSYKVYRSNASDGAYTYISDSSAASYTDSGLSAGISYYYKVSAIGAGGESVLSAGASGLTVPGAPAGVSTSAFSSSLRITWSAVTGASSYKVYINTETTPPNEPSCTVSALSAVLTGLTNETPYYVWIQAVNAGGGSALSEWVSGTPTNHFTVNSLAAFQNAVTTINNDTAAGEYRITVTGNFAVTGGSFSANAGKTGKTILIEGDSTIRTISNGKDYDYLFDIPGGIELILGNNITFNGSGQTLPVININAGGTLIMNSGAKITGANSSGVRIEGGNFTMNGGEISANSYRPSNYGGGGVYVISGSFTMNGGTISGNSHSAVTSSRGGGVYVRSGSFAMSGGTISDNSANSSSSTFSASAGGGGVYVASRGSFSMSGGTISGNSASASASSASDPAYGGGVYVESGGIFSKTNGTITDTNTLSPHNNLRGRVVYVQSGSKHRETTAGPTVNLSTTSSVNWD